MIPAMLTESLMRERAGDEVFLRGKQYYRQGAVTSLIQRGDTIEAEVEGSDIEPYLVTVTLSDDEIEAECTCPYEWGEWCKHIVAVLLAFQEQPETIEVHASLDTLLEPLDREALCNLVRYLVARDPRLLTESEASLELAKKPLAPPPASSSQQSSVPPPVEFPPLDPRPIRQQVRSAMRGMERSSYYDGYGRGGIGGEIEGLIAEAENRVEAGDGRNAMTILEAITEECTSIFEILDDSDGELGDFFDELGSLWTEAILTTPLTPPEGKAWEKKLEKWHREISDYGVDEAFLAAIEAAKQGWDIPYLQRILQGALSPEERAGQAVGWLDANLTNAYLNILERQRRFEEALYLAAAERQSYRYTSLLVQLGRIAEAVEYGVRNLDSTEDALALAQALQERNAFQEALRIGERGLELAGAKYPLGTWLSERAMAASQPDLAQRALRTAIVESPALNDYQQLKRIAGGAWPQLREELLTALRQRRSYASSGQIDIYLHENLIEDALAAVKSGYDYETLGRVMEAATPTHPNEVIPVCQEHAESIMDAGKADRYHHAARWLARAKAAYRAADRMAEWQTYLTGLLKKHERKYKLMPLLKALER